VGRYAEIVNKYGSEVVGIDMSYAIDTAFENMGLRGKVHFIQADIFNLPFKPGTFDYIFSIGVILINPHWYNNDAAPKG
jgi:SAM-dependent methyltransferase